MNERQLFQRLIAQTSPAPVGLEVSTAEGIFLIDQDGKKYVDLISGIGVSIVGHRHPYVITAIKAQLDKYMHTMVWGEHILSPQVRLAEKLHNTLPPRIDNFYFLNSGTEAVELALKLARRHTGRQRIISCMHAYHGSTQGAAALMSDTFFTGRTRPMSPDIAHIPYNEQQYLDRIDQRTAAVIIEVVQAEAGIYPADKEYLTKLRERCNETGALLIFDEIQSGLGRTGSWWAFEKYQTVPDILLSGKGLGGGLPLSMVAAPKEIMQDLACTPVLGHITTYGGNPVSCAAAISTIDVIEQEQLIGQVAEKEKSITSILTCGKIKQLRVAGLWAAIELDEPQLVQDAIRSLQQEGILTDWFLFNDKSLRIAPPLTISAAQLESALQKINGIISML